MNAEKPLQIFLAYSRRDKEILDELRIHLKVLERIQNVNIWYDGLIEVGHDWEQSIKDNLHQADIILLLISQNFLASDYCYDTEMTNALALHDSGKVRAIPIIARSSLWHKTPFARLQALPKDGQPIISNWGIDREAPYLQIIEELESIINDIYIQKNTFTDPRDGQTYKTVELLGQTWLAENLNFDVGNGCWFYDNDPKNGETYGRLYTWEAAQKACPRGWRLPTDKEWQALANYYGGYYDYRTKNRIGDARKAYVQLLKGGQSGFDALLGGSRYADGSFLILGTNGFYWSATERDGGLAYAYNFSGGGQRLDRYYNGKGYGRSVRCLQI